MLCSYAVELKLFVNQVMNIPLFWLAHISKGDNLLVFCFFTDTVQARSFKFCIIITLFRVYQHNRFDNPDLVSRSQVCQNHKQQIIFSPWFLCTVVKRFYTIVAVFVFTYSRGKTAGNDVKVYLNLHTRACSELRLKMTVLSKNWINASRGV